MAKSTRVTVLAEGGRQYNLTFKAVAEKVARREMEWITEGVSARWIVSRRGYFDASGFFTDRCFWAQHRSAGFSVLQMRDLPRGARILRPLEAT